ncbi:ankyrin [Delitschia confertaspora ATCC 74209]|uniref:Ankyrin n=1 Tax=Delitschia confertaspora ATCC 74209 TaxID=1513339 RepID=A0A9P4JMY5_9PLEO|nr:ankyrin [Delitschia confertaspora ATCC 74209]
MPLPNSALITLSPLTLANGMTISQSHLHPLIDELSSACTTGDVATVQRILSELDPFSPDTLPTKAHIALQQALQSAVQNHHHSIVRLLLAHGMLPFPLSSVGLLAAFQQSDIKMLKTFIEGGWDVNEPGRRDGAVNEPGQSLRPLLFHALSNADLRRFLLEQGANPNVQNQRGMTPLELAAEMYDIEIVRELLQHGGDPSGDDSLVLAAAKGKLDVVQLLVEAGAGDLNRVEKVLPMPWGQRRRRTAVEAAREARHEEVVRWLEERASPSS